MLDRIAEILESITGFANKVAYRAFPEGEAPSLPFICYLETGSNNFVADNVVYYSNRAIDIELYSQYRDLESEALIEEALNNNEIVWTRNVDYINSEQCYMTTYTIAED